MKLVTKWCKGCGKIMWDVQPNKRFCEKCEKQKEQERRRRARDRAKILKDKGEVKVKAPARFKSIAQCVREAQKLGISYGVYVGRGLDKVVIE